MVTYIRHSFYLLKRYYVLRQLSLLHVSYETCEED